jgi:hypothetical protein
LSNKVSIKHISWRNGRPRFNPGPTMRALGYVGRDLRDEKGRWLSLHETIAFSHDVGTEVSQKKGMAKGQSLAPKPKPAKLTNRAGYIYFLRCDGRMKIGFTTNPLKRLMVLKTAVSHEIDGMAIIPGTEREERRAHLYLGRHRRHGEWFDCHPDVTKVMVRSLTFGRLLLEEDDGEKTARIASPVAPGLSHGVA